MIQKCYRRYRDRHILGRMIAIKKLIKGNVTQGRRNNSVIIILWTKTLHLRGPFGWKLEKFENFFGEKTKVLLYDVPFKQYLCAIKGGLWCISEEKIASSTFFFLAFFYPPSSTHPTPAINYDRSLSIAFIEVDVLGDKKKRRDSWDMGFKGDYIGFQNQKPLQKIIGKLLFTLKLC